MSLELANKTAEACTFAPADHLLGIVQSVIASRVNTRVALPKIGEVVILPVRGEYYTNVREMAEFCATPATLFETEVIGDAVPDYAYGFGRSIRDLMWQAAFHASQGRLPEGCTKYDVVQLRHWPNLTRLPITPNTARICALLTRSPTTIMLVHRILGIAKEEVYQIYSAAHSAGISAAFSSNPAEAAAAEAVMTDAAPRGLIHSLFAKISGL